MGDLSELVTGGTADSASVQVKSRHELPVCPYCHKPVPKIEQDRVHFPVPKREGGTQVLIGCHTCNLLAEGNTPAINDVRKTYALYKYFMRIGVMASNQRRALLRLRVEDDRIKSFVEEIDRTKNTIVRGLRKQLISLHEPVVDWMFSVKGVGPVVIGAVVSYLWPLSRFPTMESLRHFTGNYPGKGKLTRGMKATYNVAAFRALLDLNQSAIKCRTSPLRKAYDEARAYYDEKHPELTKLHRMNFALRKVRQEFGDNLWMQSRQKPAMPNVKPKASLLVSGETDGRQHRSETQAPCAPASNFPEVNP
jgi:hypothetical protein